VSGQVGRRPPNLPQVAIDNSQQPAHAELTYKARLTFYRIAGLLKQIFGDRLRERQDYGSPSPTFKQSSNF
jgi:hypothetical protein